MAVPLCKSFILLAWFLTLCTYFIIFLDQSEIAPKNMRGRLMSIQQFTMTLGIAVAYWIDYAFMDVDGSTGWRYTAFFFGT